jgi:quinol monooxygenase YgiN
MLHVIAMIKAKPGQRDAVLAMMLANVPSVLAEAGCLGYIPAIDTGGKSPSRLGDDTLIVIERWADAESLAAHAVAPHMVSYAARAKDLVESRQIFVLDPLGT